jgi:hypothetical protein
MAAPVPWWVLLRQAQKVMLRAFPSRIVDEWEEPAPETAQDARPGTPAAAAGAKADEGRRANS